VGASQPLAQPAGGVVRGRSVEGHQRSRDPGNPDDARAPAIVRDSGDLDQVRVSADDFFEAMDSYAHGEAAACVWECESGMNCTPASSPIKRSEGRRLVERAEFGVTPAKTILAVSPSTGNGPFIHRISTRSTMRARLQTGGRAGRSRGTIAPPRCRANVVGHRTRLAGRAQKITRPRCGML
jgi:hypothetical protein